MEATLVVIPPPAVVAAAPETVAVAATADGGAAGGAAVAAAISAGIFSSDRIFFRSKSVPFESSPKNQKKLDEIK